MDSASSSDVLNDPDACWRQLCKIIAETNPSLSASLSKCRLKQVTADRVEIEVHGNGFTVSMLQREKNKIILKKACAQCFGKEKDIALIANSDSDDACALKKKQNDHALNSLTARVLRGKPGLGGQGSLREHFMHNWLRR